MNRNVLQDHWCQACWPQAFNSAVLICQGLPRLIPALHGAQIKLLTRCLRGCTGVQLPAVNHVRHVLGLSGRLRDLPAAAGPRRARREGAGTRRQQRQPPRSHVSRQGISWRAQDPPRQPLRRNSAGWLWPLWEPLSHRLRLIWHSVQLSTLHLLPGRQGGAGQGLPRCTQDPPRQPLRGESGGGDLSHHPCQIWQSRDS